ncbi:uncharacterized protein LOC141998375 [Natator depressus]|uniref:uncharacterized protein LOC141998375 n=1 Tax=Natator depressus TaxID=27790 RepID=UPI003EB7EFFB
MPKYLKKISKGMMDRGYNRDPQQYRMKIKELRQAYQKTKEANGRSGSEPQTCRFYDELHAILGCAPTTTPLLSVDTCKGGVSCNRDKDLGDEEEEEDSAQQASGETVLPDSQELFITLEPIPSQASQGRLPDHEAGEGTSEIREEDQHCPESHLQLRMVEKELRGARDMYAQADSNKTAREQLSLCVSTRHCYLRSLMNSAGPHSHLEWSTHRDSTQRSSKFIYWTL